MEFIQHEKIDLKSDPNFNEAWVQDIIAKNPSIIGLGDLEIIDKERIQPRKGRLDFLMQDTDESTRYEVELQLGPCDESHIIRTIEYWDYEKRKSPHYEHRGVIIAEDVTTRFLNVISLFNRTIPIIALQMNAIKIENKISLVFTKVLDETGYEAVFDEEEDYTEVDRKYWENKNIKDSLAKIDDVFKILNEVNDQITPKYNKYYIGLKQNGSVNNFIWFRPRKKKVMMGCRLEKSDELDNLFEENSILSKFKHKRYIVHLTHKNIEEKKELIKQVLQKAHDNK